MHAATWQVFSPNDVLATLGFVWVVLQLVTAAGNLNDWVHARRARAAAAVEPEIVLRITSSHLFDDHDDHDMLV